MDIKSQKSLLYNRLCAEARGYNLEIDEELSSIDKPWGAYVRIANKSVPAFIDAYWSDIQDALRSRMGKKLDPKLLLVAPGHQLSLQYHHRRKEHWRVVSGPIQIILGENESSLITTIYQTGETIEIPCGYWHRIKGLSGWGLIAELWDHTDIENPSDETDIVRVEDDFSRTSG